MKKRTLPTPAFYAYSFSFNFFKMKTPSPTTTRSQFLCLPIFLSFLFLAFYHPLSNLAFYRLKMVELDGKTDFSKIISIQSKSASKVKIYPSVTSGQITLEGAKSFEVINMVGQIVLSQTAISHPTLTIHHLQNGIYLIKGIDTEGSVFSEKIIKQ